MKNILVEQNPHWSGKLKNYTHREKLKKLIDYLPLKQIITITGIRRCGKSTLTRLAINYLISSGVEPKNILFMNLEQPYFLEHKHNPSYMETIYEEYLKLMNPSGKIYVFFDEIQFFDSWQIYIKSKYESSDIKFIITGSNSSMLSNELNTLLSGRSLNIHLDTFSFGEFLDFKGIEYKSELDRVTNKIAIARAKDEYLLWGGFYEVFSIDSESAKKELLISYAKNIIYQDIIPRYGLRNSEIIERLFFYLLSNATGTLNYLSMSAIFDISDKSIKEYIRYFEDVFLLARIDRYHTKQKEQIKSSKKIYVLDNGFLQIVPKETKNLGVSLENWVFNILNQKGKPLYYLKDTHEVDFYTDGALYQVALNIDDEKTKKRETRAFEQFAHIASKKRIVALDSSLYIDDMEVIRVEYLAIESLFFIRN